MINKKGQSDYVKESFRISRIPIIKDNLRRFKNISKLGFTPEEIFEQSINERRYNLSSRKPFDYNISTLLTYEFKSLKSRAPFIFKIEKQLSYLINNYPTEKLKKTANKNFADLGLMTSFAEFCRKRKIEILELEPPNPSSKGELDFLIKIDNRNLYVECYSPIESLQKGKQISTIIKNKIHKNKLRNIGNPLILIINVAEPYWSNNRLNRGLVSDFMFSSIKEVRKAKLDLSNFPDISIALIKYGNKLYVSVNKSSTNPLTLTEIEKLTKPFLIQRLKDTFIGDKNA